MPQIPNESLQTQESSIPNQVQSVSFREALWFWFKLGWLSFGGPAGQIALMHQELVERKRWISENRFLHALNYCMVLPGPEAQQLATYIGWLMHKTRGGIVAGVLFVLPSLFILIALSWVYIAYGSHWLVAGLFYGIKPAVTAIVVQATHRIGSRALKNNGMWGGAAFAFVLIFAFEVPFPIIVLLAAIVGYMGGKFKPDLFKAAAGHKKSDKEYGPALIDDNTPTPEHAFFSKSKLVRVVFIGFLLWIVPMAVLCVIYGIQNTYTQMAWFFTKAAWLTFGGAYAVLPYVYQGAVDHYLWLSPTQMVDGLALGETTPGPLIMVVAYVGFVGSYLKEVLGADLLFLSGALGACIVTWFTFLPSFILILGGAPFVESTHKNLKLTSPLTAITAAVVGVVFNLAVFFAYHVWWPTGFSGQMDWIAIVISGAATLALFRFKRTVIEVILGSAVLGLIVSIFSKL